MLLLAATTLLLMLGILLLFNDVHNEEDVRQMNVSMMKRRWTVSRTASHRLLSVDDGIGRRLSGVDDIGTSVPQGAALQELDGSHEAKEVDGLVGASATAHDPPTSKMARNSPGPTAVVHPTSTKSSPSMSSMVASRHPRLPPRLPTFNDCGRFRCRFQYLNGTTRLNVPFPVDSKHSVDDWDVPYCSDVLYDRLAR